MIWLLLLLPWLADAKVERIVSGKELELSGAPGCFAESRFAIFSQDEEGEALGYAAITGPGSTPFLCRAEVQSHTRSALIRVGDRTEALNLRRRDANIPGRYDLVLENSRKVATRYKPLVYAGYLFGETASTLAKGEKLLGPSAAFYGLSNRVQLEAFPWLVFDQVASLGVKYKFIDGEDLTFALQGRVNQHYDVGKRSWSATIYYDSTSNSHSMSHTTLTFTSKLPTSTFLEEKAKEERYSAELTSTYEWVLKGWQRILLGPKITVGKQNDVGFVATAVFPYDYFNWAVNVELNSLTRFEFKNKKQLATGDIFWRF